MARVARQPPTVRLDGEKVRRIREAKGLTQLYVAEVAGVTVDTVSRWENNRTAAVKRENAEALAGALEVDLSEVLRAEASDGDRQAPTGPRRIRRRYWILAALAAVGLVLAILWRPGSTPPPLVQATRSLPPYTPPRSRVPVLVEVRVLSGEVRRAILRESLPAGWRIVASSPEPDQGPAPDGTAKWILPLDDQARVVYLAEPPDPAAEGSVHRFRGEVVTAAVGGRRLEVAGGQRIDLEYVHWADRDADFQISDAEVLAALEKLEGAPELGVDPADLRRLWGAPEYEYDRTEGRFSPLGR